MTLYAVGEIRNFIDTELILKGAKFDPASGFIADDARLVPWRILEEVCMDGLKMLDIKSPRDGVS